MQNNEFQMECKVENKSPISRELTITVMPETVQRYIDKQFAVIQKKAKIKGFRPGKVPMQIIKQYYLSDAKTDAYSSLIQDSYVRALSENKINAIGNPQIEPKSGLAMGEGEKLTYVAKVEILPEIKLGDFSKIKVSKPNDQINKDEIEKTITSLQQSYAEVSPHDTYEGPAKHGDFLELSFAGTIDGKTDQSLNGNNRMLKVGAGQYLDGFETNVLGMKKGENKTFKMTFPKDYGHKEYANKEVEFSVTVHEFKKEVLPELNDDFAKQFRAESMTELRKNIENDMKKNSERRSRTTLRERVVDALIEASPFEVPANFVQMQMDHLIQENAQTLKQQGMTDKMIREFLEKNIEELKARALKQVKASLILDKAALDLNVKIEDADLEREYQRLAEEEKMNIEDVRKYFDNDNSKRELKFRLKEDRTFDEILGKIKVTAEK